MAMRIDVFLANSGILQSRTEAKKFIENGWVFVDSKPVDKPSMDVSGVEDRVFVDLSQKQFVSRGGIKLNGALKAFNVDPHGKKCLDIGASSGGFTDCLLQQGASHVIAVDSGYGQIAQCLRENDRVTVIENYNARYMKPTDFSYVPELVVMDVSFISATYIIPQIYECLCESGEFICLIKPQFEVGKDGLGKGGVVKDSKVREQAFRRVLDFAGQQGFSLRGTIESPIRGGDGNIEYLAYFVK